MSHSYKRITIFILLCFPLIASAGLSPDPSHPLVKRYAQLQHRASMQLLMLPNDATTKEAMSKPDLLEMHRFLVNNHNDLRQLSFKSWGIDGFDNAYLAAMNIMSNDYDWHGDVAWHKLLNGQLVQMRHTLTEPYFAKVS